jgi:hypothetical protein
MAEPQDRVTRFAGDLVEAARIEGARESRSAKQQLDHWARVGRAVSSFETAARLRVQAALSGQLPMQQLNGEESLVFNAEIDVAIEENLAAGHYGRRLAAAGVTTVALDDEGRLVEHRPDGTTTVLSILA